MSACPSFVTGRAAGLTSRAITRPSREAAHDRGRHLHRRRRAVLVARRRRSPAHGARAAQRAATQPSTEAAMTKRGPELPAFIPGGRAPRASGPRGGYRIWRSDLERWYFNLLD